MRTVLFGATDLSLAVAEQLHSLGLPIAGILHVGRAFPISYRPDGVSNVRFGDMASWAREHAVPEQLYETTAAAAAFASSVGADFALVAGWYHMVPRSLRAVFPRGCAGLHASLLPKFRGGAPLNWALLAREPESGVTLFELGDGVDDGPIYGQRRFAIGPRAVIADLVRNAEEASLALLAECLPAVADGALVPRPQRGIPSYCLQRFPEDGLIDWRQSTETIDRLVRAVGRPYPGAFTFLDGEMVCVWSAEPVSGVHIHGMPGQIARLPDEADPVVVTGDGSLILREATDPTGRSLMADLRRAANRRFESGRRS